MSTFDPFAGEERLVEGGLEILAEAECLTLAASRPIGRVAISMGALPMVFPVNFCLVGRDVVFRTAPGTKLDAALRGAVVAFQVDDFEPVGHRGWSVLIVGLARALSRESAASLGPLPVSPWVPGHRDHVVRIDTEFLSGRRIAWVHHPYDPP